MVVSSQPRVAGGLARWYEPTMLGLALGLVVVWLDVLRTASAIMPPGDDLQLWVAFGNRWMDTGSIYTLAQVAGPVSGEVHGHYATATALYPPAAVPLFLAAAMLPAPLAPLWWLIPLGLTAWVIARLRPAAWTWPIMAALLAWPQWSIWAGGTSMWVMAAVATGPVWRWPAALVLAKPTLAPLALIGVRDRRWWIAAGAVGLLTLAGPWPDYLATLRNLKNVGWSHNLGETPMVLVPVVAWLGSGGRVRRALGVRAVPRRWRAVRAPDGRRN
ncbi:MAG TPA: hypothetical protein VIR16_02635 [Candidatus Limnocylindrales bacterium]